MRVITRQNSRVGMGAGQPVFFCRPDGFPALTYVGITSPPSWTVFVIVFNDFLHPVLRIVKVTSGLIAAEHDQWHDILQTRQGYQICLTTLENGYLTKTVLQTSLTPLPAACLVWSILLLPKTIWLYFPESAFTKDNLSYILQGLSKIKVFTCLMENAVMVCNRLLHHVVYKSLFYYILG